jgi:hypothetical protein
MAFYTNLFSPDTYETFSRSSRDVSGFSKHQHSWARRIQKGDRFICYMTKVSRWVGVLEVLGECYVDDTPLFYPDGDPYVIRFRVRPIVWLLRDQTIPIHEKRIWDALSFTRGVAHNSPAWTGKLRTSLNKLAEEDAQFLQDQLLAQQAAGARAYPVDEDEYRRWLAQRVRRPDKVVPVTVPSDDEDEEPDEQQDRSQSVRESAKVQALLASIGEKMGFKIWLPKSDRSAVLQEWKPVDGALMNVLPLNYNEPTLQTIEQIDVLWLKGRAIVRAFEVEHTTAVYSGILRMADLLALQPNMDIKLHVVAPESRKAKVMGEIQRPVFSLLDKGPLSDYCTFLSYDRLRELSQLKHLQHMSDEVLEEYAEGPD